MSSCTVYVVVEGLTEFTFIREMLAPALGSRQVFLHAIEIGRSGRRGGDVRFARARNDIVRYLKQQSDAYVTTMFDFYAIGSDWPGLDTVVDADPASHKVQVLEQSAADRVVGELPESDVGRRFIPYLCLHEFEALLFSDSSILARGLGVSESTITNILRECGEPEEINDNPQTAPSKRILGLKPSYGKVRTGNSIAAKIGLAKMREACPHFDQWVTSLEDLAVTD